MSAATPGKAKTLELSAPQKLNDNHDLSKFACGEPSIDEYLHKRARKAQAARHAVVYVVCVKGTLAVAGYYTLSNGSVIRANVVPRSLQRNSPDHHPVTVLGRMGISAEAQGMGYAADLLQDAVERCVGAAQAIGSSAIVVHPLNDKLADFYARYGFVACPSISPVTMMLSLR
ncbi:GNAT family N-acetyltransferase [Pseudomonas sp. UBA4194]|uniref:GNAT family N-acetyltransferase n=1 Tax=Pseudomonas sp. UBA4194 TaxID=1947317 RepID=UPI0025F52E0C|nr:GNAT family N-acetyltransferase [Pseudomonas sp. UBA4194]